MSIYRKSVIFERGESFFFCEEQTLYGSARLGTEQVEHSMRGLVSNDGLTDAIIRAREQHGDEWQQRLQEQYDGRFYERLQDAWGNEWNTRLDLLLQGNNDTWLVEQIRNESYTLQAGNKRFELSNHLGNVLAVVSDKKVQTDGVVWQAEVVSAQDYFPFGMAMPGRSTDAKHRYGFNGKETDPETGLNDFGARMMDSRIGRWLAMDPLTAKFPAWSPYVSMNNNPIRLIDPNGKEVKLDLNRCGDFKTKEEREKFHFKVLNDLQSLTNDKVEFHEDKPGSNIFTLKIVEKGTANGGSPLNTGTKLIEDLVRAEKTVTIVDGAPLANETGSRNRTSTCPANEALVLNKQPVSCTVRYTGLRGAVAEGGNRSGVPDGTPDLPDGAVGGLGHELFHAEDLLYGKVASHQAWVEDFDVPAGSSVRMRNMSEAERSVRARENKLRAEQKMPLRVMPRLIEAPHPEPPRQRGPFLGDDCLYIK